VYEFGLKILDANEKLFRFYYYDCPPFEGMLQNPILGQKTDFAQTKTSKARKQFLYELAKKDQIAFRRGTPSFDGWQITGEAVQRLIKASSSASPTPVTLLPDDVHPQFTQNGWI
jgi:hypothetical protein